MQKIIEELAAQVDASLAGVTSSESLAAFWQEYLSKNGKVPGLMKQLHLLSDIAHQKMSRQIIQHTDSQKQHSRS